MSLSSPLINACFAINKASSAGVVIFNKNRVKELYRPNKYTIQIVTEPRNPLAA